MEENQETTPEDANKTDNHSHITDKEDYDGTTAQDLLQDGADSGVEARALSSNASSDRATPGQSCGSSLVSCYSEPEDRGSECGSETSSNKPRVNIQTRGPRKKSGGSCSESSSTCDAPSRSVAERAVRKSAVTARRTESARVASKEKPVRSQSGARNSNTTAKSAPARTRTKPDNDDGRWPSVGQKPGARSRGTSAVDPARGRNVSATSSATMSSSTISANSMTSSYGSLGLKQSTNSNALEKYATLPRRPKKKASETLDVPSSGGALVRSNSVTREPSLNRAATLRRQQSKEKETSVTTGKSLPPYPRGCRQTSKTVIYHETSVQTVLTGEDVGRALCGVSVPAAEVTPVTKRDKAVQSEGKERLKKLEESFTKQTEELEKCREENERLKKEREDIGGRIWRMLGIQDNGGAKVADGPQLSRLERHLQKVGVTVLKQKEELSELKHYKTVAQRDLEKSLAAQKTLLQQQQDFEAEFLELQEFLQAEKTMLSESLQDTEEEMKKLKTVVDEKQSALEQQEAECKHLVRICEQRRQENLSLEAKLSGLEQRSRDVLLQQGAAVSGAAVALSGLGARLDSLVEQLSESYNVSEKDLEDVIFHNEAYPQSEGEGSSPDISPDGSPPMIPSIADFQASPKRGASFLNAVLGAIRNATQSPFASGRRSPPSATPADPSSESLGLLDSELEPCMVLETVFEENGSLLLEMSDSAPSTARYGGDSSTDDGKPQQGKLCHSDSLQNLSAAILARQIAENVEDCCDPAMEPAIEVSSLVDQVIDVDNLVTKLLKVLRIVQMENDTCVDQLHHQRVELLDKFKQEQLYRQRTDDNFQRLQIELTEARCQLNSRIVQLEEAKKLLTESCKGAAVESQRQYNTIDNALEALHSIQELVDQHPPLVKIQQELEECNFRTVTGDDFNANSSPSNGNGIDNTTHVKHKTNVLTTAI